MIKFKSKAEFEAHVAHRLPLMWRAPTGPEKYVWCRQSDRYQRVLDSSPYDGYGWLNLTSGFEAYGHEDFISIHEEAAARAGGQVHDWFPQGVGAKVKNEREPPHEPTLIGLTSRYHGEGKSTTARAIAHEFNIGYGSRVVSFADPLREMATDLYGDHFDSASTMLKDTPMQHTSLTPRQALVLLATTMRKHLGDDIFVAKVGDKLAKSGHCNLVVVDDVYFPVEADYIRANGVLVEVVRDAENKHTRTPHILSADYILDLDDVYWLAKFRTFLETK